MSPRGEPTSGYFSASLASTYDRKIRAGIPAYESLHGMTALLMSAALPQEASVLVVGAGTGMDLVTLGAANPRWTFTAVDPSDDMLSRCADAVHGAGMSDRVRVHRGDVDALDGARRYDGATSLLVSHFIKGAEARTAFYRSIAERLVAGGVLVTADLVADTSDPTFELFTRAWKAHYANAGIPAQEVEADFDRSMKAVSFVPEHAVLGMLATAGYGTVRQFYRALHFSGWICFKR